MTQAFRFNYSELYRNARKNAYRRSIPFELSLDEFNDLVVDSHGRCAVSGIAFRYGQPSGLGTKRPFIPSLDRIDSSQGYSKLNCRIVCVFVNYAMNDFGEQPLRELMRDRISTQTPNHEFLNDLQLAARWGYADATPTAIKKKHQRLRTLPKTSPRHLKSLTVGKSILYPVRDLLAYEMRNTK